MADEERLVVLLEARIVDFEKNMAKASGSAKSNFDKMRRESEAFKRQLQADMAASGGNVTAFASNFARTFGAALFSGAALKGIRSAIGSVADLADQADRVGVSAKGLQEFRYATAMAGATAEQADKALEKFVQNLSQAGAGGGQLGKIFAANGISIRNARGELIDTNTALSRFADLLRGAKNPADQLALATEAFGREGGAAMVNALRDGGDALASLRHEADNLGLIISDEQIQAARELDDQFTKLEITAVSWAKSAAIEVAEVLIPVLEDAGGVINRLIASFNAMRGQSMADQQSMLKDPRFGAYGDLAQNKGTPLGDAADFYGAAAPNFKKAPEPRLPVTMTPRAGSGGGGGGRGGGGGGSGQDKAEKTLKDLREQLAIQKELATTTGDIAARERVLNALRRAGVSETSAQGKLIAALVPQLDAASGAVKRLEDAHKAANDAAHEFAQIGASAFERLLVDGASLSDVLKDVVAQLAKAAIQAALLGEGPLGGLFGMGGGKSSAGGVGGGLFGMLFTGLMGGFAEGGLVSGPGSSTSDSIPARLSNGEFVVNARAASQHRDILHAINSGRLQAFANGGEVGKFASVPASIRHGDSTSQFITLAPTITVNATGGTPQQNGDLAKQVSRQVENSLRGLVTDEMRRQMRPGGIFR